jgi:hypothetical protein
MDELQQLKDRVNLLENIIFAFAKSDNYYFSKHFVMGEGMIIKTGTGTGLKIGGATTQKLGFYNVTPVVQHSSTGVSAGFVAGGGTTVTHTSTFTGNSGSTAYTIGDIVVTLKEYGFLPV